MRRVLAWWTSETWGLCPLTPNQPPTLPARSPSSQIPALTPGPNASTHSPCRRRLLDWLGCSRNQPSSCWAAQSFCILTTTWEQGRQGPGHSGLFLAMCHSLRVGDTLQGVSSTSGRRRQLLVLGTPRLALLVKWREVPKGGVAGMGAKCCRWQV
jgi:hypothetical protein